MITLKQLVEQQKFTNEKDNELVAMWFQENDMAMEGIEIIYKLAKDKIRKVEQTRDEVTGDMVMYGVTGSLIKVFGLEDGCKLDHITRLYIINKRTEKITFEERYPEHIEWLKRIIPTKNTPKIFWNDFYEYLHTQGIYFKDEKKGGEV